METLETNVAKIQIGNSKQTNTYVTTLAERTVHEDCELFAVVALPLLNPAAADDCERIGSGILGALRRCFKRSANENTFEVALGEINDEIGKLASLGQHNWTGKISAVIGARLGSRFYVTATGKASALLMRAGEFSEITETSNPKHVLKTFDTFSAGKIKVGDVLIVTTAELFNHVSIDRIKNILSQNTLEIAAQEMVRIIEDTAGPEVAFGTLLLQETEPLMVSEGIQTSDFVAQPGKSKLLDGLSGKAKQVMSRESALKIWQTVRTATKRRPNLSMKKLSGMALAGSSAGLSRIKEQAQNYKNIDFKAPVSMFKGFSKSKKFFAISVLVLLLAVIVNLFVARGKRNVTSSATTFEQNKTTVVKILSDADGKLVFKDELTASSLINEAREKVKTLAPANAAQEQAKADLEKQIIELTQRINKIETPTITSLATLSNSGNLIALPNILATATGKVVVSYNINTKTTEDGTLRTNTDIVDSAYISDTQALIFDGQGLNIWNYSKGTNGGEFFLNVPKASDFMGFVRYPTNNRVYTADVNLGQVISYLLTGSTISKPVVSVKDSAIKDAQDIAVDGNVYVLTKTGVNKYNAGKPAAFTFPVLAEAFSGKGKLYTDTKSKNLYILDSNGRIIITDKTGKLTKILQSNELTGATDFTVDETNKTIFVLRSGSLLELHYSP